MAVYRVSFSRVAVGPLMFTVDKTSVIKLIPIGRITLVMILMKGNRTWWALPRARQIQFTVTKAVRRST
jgi:hypothetical protein